ncbi:hypothetical protein DY000_02047631 [Brassica cretica]|uniref:Uncharacterized protein n=1 Tax=Brassica cretica TaxID=69181 RepID=A0ABQ7EV68_BRACR|nr:hypothetical protein DY000_02047631 [Brassica cretica]
MKTSPNHTDESSSLSFTSLLTVLRSNSWRPPWGMGKYLRRRLNWSPFCRCSIVLLSLDRSVVTRRRSFPCSLSTRSLAVTRRRSFSRSRSDRSLTVTRLNLTQSLREYRSLAVDRISLSRGHSTRTLAITRGR